MNDKLHGIDGDNYRLTAEQIAAYHEHGYIVLESVVTEEEIATFESIYDEFIAGQVSGMGRDFCDMSGPYDRKFDKQRAHPL